MSELTEESIDFDAESELSLNVNVDWNIFVDYGMPNIWLYYISYGIFLSILRIFKGAEDVTWSLWRRGLLFNKGLFNVCTGILRSSVRFLLCGWLCWHHLGINSVGLGLIIFSFCFKVYCLSDVKNFYLSLLSETAIITLFLIELVLFSRFYRDWENYNSYCSISSSL